VGWSIKIATVKDIEIKVHLTFLFIILWAAIEGGAGIGGGLRGAIFGIVSTTLLFFCVVLHELGHSFQALRYKVKVRNITLLPIGGVAQMESIPEKPSQELAISLAGPAVNFAIAGLLAPLALWILGTQIGAYLSQPAYLLSDTGQRVLSWILDGLFYGTDWKALIFYLLSMNVSLGVFNLIPAFPMDGGRVLRALLALRLDYLRATGIAVNVGRGLAVLLGVAGLMLFQFPLVLIAVFIYAGGGYERQMVEVKKALQGLQVSQAVTRQLRTVTPTTLLTHVLDLIFHGYQSNFPVVEGRQLVGVLVREDILATLRERGPNVPVGQVMRTDFPVVNLSDSLLHVQQLIAKSGVKAVPVIEDGFFRGLITLDNINETYTLLSTRRPTS
jgi:Zn-dependent protease/CBS domain-containing protein